MEAASSRKVKDFTLTFFFFFATIIVYCKHTLEKYAKLNFKSLEKLHIWRLGLH